MSRFMMLVLAGMSVMPMMTATLLASTGVPSDARAAIAAANAEWLPALKAHDAATIAAPYADDGIFVGPDGTVAKGRDAVAEMMRVRFAKTGQVTGGQLVQDGVIRQGALIYEWGHADIEVAREGAAPAHSFGRYLTVWRKSANGRWQIVRNLSLSD